MTPSKHRLRTAGRRLPRSDRLRDELGVPGKVVALRSSPRSRVWRVELAGAPAVIKQVVGGADATNRYQREAAALAFAGRVRPPVSPAVLGLDAAANLIVLEYLPHQRPGPDWVVHWASALGRLHAAIGPDDDTDSLPLWTGPSSRDVENFLRFARSLPVTVSSRVEEELAALLVRLAPAGQKVLLHGDPCPGNDLHTDAGVRFVDFEQASLGRGATELAYLRAGFPTCWCVTTVGIELVAEAEATYRRHCGSREGAPADVADACAGWLVRGDALVEAARRGTGDQFGRLAARDWRWGTATARQRVAHRLGALANLDAGCDSLAGLVELAAVLRTRMLARWPVLGPPPDVRPD